MPETSKLQLPIGNRGKISILGYVNDNEVTKVTFAAHKLWLDFRIWGEEEIEARIKKVAGGDCILTWEGGRYPEALIIFVMSFKTSAPSCPIRNEKRILQSARRKLDSVLWEVECDSREYDRSAREARGY